MLKLDCEKLKLDCENWNWTVTALFVKNKAFLLFSSVRNPETLLLWWTLTKKSVIHIIAAYDRLFQVIPRSIVVLPIGLHNM